MRPVSFFVLCAAFTQSTIGVGIGWPWRKSDTQQRLGNDPPSGWHDPADGGGRMLDYSTIYYGEPLNVIISGDSHPDVLTHQGLHKYAKSIGFSEECLGLHLGDLHSADLGDGEGRKYEQFLARQHYFPIWGTCWESLAGGNHFRAWQQKDTKAWFLAVSKEKYVGEHHQIIDDGYNIGRDYLVSRALRKGARVEWREDLLKEGNEGTSVDPPPEAPLFDSLPVQKSIMGLPKTDGWQF